MNKNLAMLAVFVLLLSLNVTTTVAQVTVVKVDPSLIEYHEDATGQQFTIAVKIVDVTNLYGFDIKFRWNTTYLEYVSHSVHVPKDTYPDGVLWKPILPVKDEVNTTAGTYWIAYASMWPAPSFNGSGTVFTMTFRVKYHPAQSTTEIPLELYSIDLSNKAAEAIPYTKQDGKVILYALIAGHDIAVTHVNPWKNIVGQGYSMNINVTVANKGEFTETFNVTLYANTTAIETKEITLESGATANITFTWDTTEYAKGNYTLWAYAEPVPGETDTSDNTLSDSTVYVGIPGDINSDSYVNAKDAVALGKAFNSQIGEPTYDPNADLNNDGFINAKDAVILGKYFGQQDQ